MRYKFNFLLFAVSLFLLTLASFLFFFEDSSNFEAIITIIAFCGIAFSSMSHHVFKGYSYTIWILTAVITSMFYPDLFISIGDFHLKNLIVPLLQIIMFGIGSQMSLQDFAGIIKMPKGVVIGIICQFTIMPFVGVSIAYAFHFPAEIAAGIVLVGTSPSGLASNVMSFLARANLALSVTLTAVSTLLAPLLTPLLMKLLAGQMVDIDFWKMMNDIFNMVVMPIIAGLIFNLFSSSRKHLKQIFIQMLSYITVIVLKNLFLHSSVSVSSNNIYFGLIVDLCWFAFLPVTAAILFKYIANGNQEWLKKTLAFISMIGIGIIITIITAAGRDSLLDVGLLLIFACLIHNLAGYCFGYYLSKFLLKIPENDCRAIAIEVGMQNGGLASGIAMQMGKIATVGLAPAVFGPLMNVTGSILANFWKVNEPKINK